MNLYKSLFEAPIAAMDPEDEPRPKPTKTKPKDDPFDFLNDLDNIGGKSNKNLPSGPIDAQGDTPSSDRGTSGGPDIRRASGDTTRSRMAGRSASDQMRDMLGRIDMNQNDEIDDAEAARRAGLGGAERPQSRIGGAERPEQLRIGGAERPQPGQRFEVDRVRPADVPMVLNNQLRTAGEQMPEWHTINNLPGYMQRAIRGMGRQMFGMMTRTPLEQIMTIANVDGQGPNTDAEMRAVANWLMQNGEDLGPVRIDHGRAIPGYEPDVHEFTAMGLRFHVVRDQMGQYIYAYPEQDARTPGAQGRLPGGGGNNTPRLNRESRMINNIKTPVAESVQKYLAESLEIHKARTLIENKILEDLNEGLLNESTLAKLIGNEPGAKPLIRWMHDRHKLANTAEWHRHPFKTEIARTEFKAHPDHFLVIVASNGVAAMKPNLEWFQDKGGEDEWGKSVKGNNSMPYHIIAFKRDQQVDPALLRSPKDVEPHADPSVMQARMGMIQKHDPRNPDNVFERLWPQIGQPQYIYTTSGVKTGLGRGAYKTRKFVGSYGEPPEIRGDYGMGVDRAKYANKAAIQKKVGDRYKLAPLPGSAASDLSPVDNMPTQRGGSQLAQFKNTIQRIVKPLFIRIGNEALADARAESRDAAEAGEDDRAARYAGVAANIKSMLVKLDTQGDIALTGDNNPVSRLIDASIRAAAEIEGMPEMTYLKMLNTEPGAAKFSSLMTALKSNIFKVVR
jgi:hypothetical protein